MIKDQRAKLVNEYIRLSRGLTRLICHKFGAHYPLQPWLQMKLPKNGALNKSIDYCYHGKGCTFEIHNEFCLYNTINIDYYEDYIILDIWKISCFAEDNFGLEIENEEIMRQITIKKSILHEMSGKYCVKIYRSFKAESG